MTQGGPLLFALNMAAAAALLIWSIRLVRTGFERAFGGQLRLWLRRSTANRFFAAGSGAVAAVLMQSSTAVAVLMAGFVASGAIGSFAGLAIMLGADVGSAVVALILNSRISALTPILLLSGVLIFLRSSQRRHRQIGRILIGLALVFISLGLIRDASLPLTSGDAAGAVMQYLARDLVTSFLLAAAFSWLVHSSVAAVLLFAALAAHGVLPSQAAFAMILGANLGGGIIAVVLTLNAEAKVRRVVWSNLALRGGGAAAMLFALAKLPIPTDLLGANPGTQALHFHILFNVALLALCLPFLTSLMRVAKALFPDTDVPNGAGVSRSLLDPTVLDQPKRAFGCAQRELVEMANRIEAMLRDALALFDGFDDAAALRLQDENQRVAQLSLELRTYLSKVSSPTKGDDTAKRAFGLSSLAVNLEAGADAVGRKMVDLARQKDMENVSFSEEGWRELSDFADIVLRNVQHGIAVLMSEDIGLARELVAQKENIRRIEQDLQHRHLTRIRKGLSETIETSAIHLDLLRALKMLNTSFAMIAYPLLEDRGELLQSRLSVE